MLGIDMKTAKRLRHMIETLANSQTGQNTVASVCEKLDISFDEYRILSEVAMPAIANYNEAKLYKQSAAIYRNRLKQIMGDKFNDSNMPDLA